MNSLMRLEDQLVDYWRQILRKDDIQPDQNFFECGGDSLLAMQFVQMIKSNLGIKLPIKVMFEKPTIKELSILINQLRLMDSVN